MPCKCHRNDYSHIDACKRSLLMLRVFLLLLLWCSVQSGGQRHFLVHHLERLCQCDHTREGKCISRNRHLSNALSSLNWMSVGCDADGVCARRAWWLRYTRARTLGSLLCWTTRRAPPPSSWEKTTAISFASTSRTSSASSRWVWPAHYWACAV